MEASSQGVRSIGTTEVKAQSTHRFPVDDIHVQRLSLHVWYVYIFSERQVEQGINYLKLSRGIRLQTNVIKDIVVLELKMRVVRAVVARLN